MITGPSKGESGVGDYTDDLIKHVSDTNIRKVTIPLGSDNPIVFAKRAFQIARTDADVIHVQHEYGLFGTGSAMSLVFFPLLYLLTALSGTPVVVTVHEGLNENLVTEPLKLLKQVYINVLNRIVVLGADQVIFLSKTTAREFTESVPLARYSVLPHGANDGKARDIGKAESKRALGYAPDQFVITEPGYVEPRKGSEMMVDLANRMPEYEFLLAGGPAKSAYKTYYQDIVDRAPSNLTVTGMLEESRFHESFAASDLVVLPYQELEQGGVVNTLNQSGIFNRCATYRNPVVASDLPYYRDILQDWDCLKVCDFDDLDEAERTIRDLVADEDERDRLSEAIRRYASAKSFSKVGDRHRRIYRSIVYGIGERPGKAPSQVERERSSGSVLNDHS